MSTIFVIRHAEKLDGPHQGINEWGASDQESLSPRGWQRAGALALFFGSKNGLPAPDQIYAAASGKDKNQSLLGSPNHQSRGLNFARPKPVLAARANTVSHSSEANPFYSRYQIFESTNTDICEYLYSFMRIFRDDQQGFRNIAEVECENSYGLQRLADAFLRLFQ